MSDSEEQSGDVSIEEALEHNVPMLVEETSDEQLDQGVHMNVDQTVEEKVDPAAPGVSDGEDSPVGMDTDLSDAEFNNDDAEVRQQIIEGRDWVVTDVVDCTHLSKEELTSYYYKFKHLLDLNEELNGHTGGNVIANKEYKSDGQLAFTPDQKLFLCQLWDKEFHSDSSSSSEDWSDEDINKLNSGTNFYTIHLPLLATAIIDDVIKKASETNVKVRCIKMDDNRKKHFVDRLPRHLTVYTLDGIDIIAPTKPNRVMCDNIKILSDITLGESKVETRMSIFTAKLKRLVERKRDKDEKKKIANNSRFNNRLDIHKKRLIAIKDGEDVAISDNEVLSAESSTDFILSCVEGEEPIQLDDEMALQFNAAKNIRREKRKRRREMEKTRWTALRKIEKEARQKYKVHQKRRERWIALADKKETNIINTNRKLLNVGKDSNVSTETQVVETPPLATDNQPNTPIKIIKGRLFIDDDEEDEDASAAVPKHTKNMIVYSDEEDGNDSSEEHEEAIVGESTGHAGDQDSDDDGTPNQYDLSDDLIDDDIVDDCDSLPPNPYLDNVDVKPTIGVQCDVITYKEYLGHKKLCEKYDTIPTRPIFECVLCSNRVYFLKDKREVPLVTRHMLTKEIYVDGVLFSESIVKGKNGLSKNGIPLFVEPKLDTDDDDDDDETEIVEIKEEPHDTDMDENPTSSTMPPSMVRPKSEPLDVEPPSLSQQNINEEQVIAIDDDEDLIFIKKEYESNTQPMDEQVIAVDDDDDDDLIFIKTERESTTQPNNERATPSPSPSSQQNSSQRESRAFIPSYSVDPHEPFAINLRNDPMQGQQQEQIVKSTHNQLQMNNDINYIFTTVNNNNFYDKVYPELNPIAKKSITIDEEQSGDHTWTCVLPKNGPRNWISIGEFLPYQLILEEPIDLYSTMTTSQFNYEKETKRVIEAITKAFGMRAIDIEESGVILAQGMFDRLQHKFIRRTFLTRSRKQQEQDLETWIAGQNTIKLFCKKMGWIIVSRLQQYNYGFRTTLFPIDK